MSYKSEFASNNTDLQTILDMVNALPDKTGAIESTFTPTDSGGTTYKSKFADNNADLQAMLDKVNALEGVTLIEFTFDGTTYQAEEGMTWAQWIDSDYCTDSRFSYDASYAYYDMFGDGTTPSNIWRFDNYHNVSANEAIVSGLGYSY